MLYKGREYITDIKIGDQVRIKSFERIRDDWPKLANHRINVGCGFEQFYFNSNGTNLPEHWNSSHGNQYFCNHVGRVISIEVFGDKNTEPELYLYHIEFGNQFPFSISSHPVFFRAEFDILEKPISKNIRKNNFLSVGNTDIGDFQKNKI